MKRVWSILFISFIFPFFPQMASAASVTFQNAKSQLASPDEEFTVDISLSINAGNGTTYYLRGVFYKPNTTNYCGLTWNGDDWFSGPYSSNEGWKHFLPVTVSNNTWTGQLKAKIDSADNNCKDSGEYRFKIQRFTASSGSGNFDSQTEQTIQITIPTPTPTIVPTDSPTNTPTPSKTPIPTRTPTPSTSSGLTVTNTPSPTKAPTIKPSSTRTPSPSEKATPTDEPSQEVLSDKTEPISPTLTPSKDVKVRGSSGVNLGVIFISLGGVSLIACGILVAYTNRRQRSTS